MYARPELYTSSEPDRIRREGRAIMLTWGVKNHNEVFLVLANQGILGAFHGCGAQSARNACGEKNTVHYPYRNSSPRKTTDVGTTLEHSHMYMPNSAPSMSLVLMTFSNTRFLLAPLLQRTPSTRSTHNEKGRRDEVFLFVISGRLPTRKKCG